MKEEFKIKDVMVGDWVDVRNNAAPNTPHLERITPSHFLRDEHWYGVELVPEILEKNGFAFHDNDGGYYGYFEESYFSQIVEVVLFNVKNENRNCQLHISDDNITYLHVMACNYAHQLQHALKVCGIKKEIIL